LNQQGFLFQSSVVTVNQEAEYFRRGMAKVYGGQPKEVTGA
jgi:hypothetical protein